MHFVATYLFRFGILSSHEREKERKRSEERENPFRIMRCTRWRKTRSGIIYPWDFAPRESETAQKRKKGKRLESGDECIRQIMTFRPSRARPACLRDKIVLLIWPGYLSGAVKASCCFIGVHAE